ncbi:hypothetical protein GKE82_09570 [Conexibacter sp. W3-3-2]|uniref:M50 family metallopeptidase n=1 Tax=Conexibacter sp. W3-3-2 TaxID=2675227 RepID=UPI0012B9AD27|nr:M50 family metallopeptidase [Conexibacter sp. W3-3-2]MTD44532.1 hypothetical protein [Conexibacter sp. W3-3-2]
MRLPGGPEGPLRLDAADAGLLELLDGRRGSAELVAAATVRCGPDGPPRLARLVAELAERGLLQGVTPAGPGERPTGRLARLARPRSRAIPHAPELIVWLYRHGGRLLVSRPVAALAAVAAVAGLVAAVLLLVRGRAAPLVVDDRLVLGAAAFVGFRAVLVVAHELAHGLALARCGRAVDAAGVRLLLCFPYAYVDTSPVWLEPRRRRTAVTLAGPLCDLALGGIAATVALLATDPLVAQLAFQACVAAYVGALLNLNPLLDRDGYHLLVDHLGEPHLRRRAITRMQARLAGTPVTPDSGPLTAFAVATVAWGVAGATLLVGTVALSSGALGRAVPEDLRWWVLGPAWLLAVAPTAYLLGRPLRHRGLARA